MSYFPDQQRPGMRRKSSAQNLLSSFGKPTNSASTGSIPPPLNLGTSPVGSSGVPLSFASVHQAATPTTTTPTAREWDAQSLHSDAAGSSLGGAGSPQIAQGMSVEYLREMVNKRMITLTYIRSVHEGRSHWFHTVQMTRADLDRAFNNFEMKKRTPRFAILALSLSSLLEINSPQDLLKSLLTTVSEYDQAKEDGDRSRMRFLKGRNARRGTNAGIPEYAGGYPETSDISGLFSSNIPFALDYHETLISLIDVLSEVYNKISKLLGPSPFSAQANMMGPLGQLTPQPGVSYLFSGENVPTAVPNQPQTHHNHSSSRHLSTANIHQLLSNSQSSSNEQPLSSSLWGIAHASLMAQGPGGLSSPPSGNWAPNFGEMLLKIDGKFKKITGMLLKDLDDLARKSIQDELASLDPLLRNIAGPLENLPSSTRYEYGEAM